MKSSCSNHGDVVLRIRQEGVQDVISRDLQVRGRRAVAAAVIFFLQHIFIEHDVHIAVRIDECAEYGCGADFRFQHRLHELGRRERHMRNTKRLRKILSSKRLIPEGDEKEEIALLVIAEKQRLYHLHVKLFIDRRTVLLLEHGKREEVTEFLEKNKLHPKIHFTTWDDYAIMSMVEMGLGISVLPKLILQRVPYRIKMLPLSTSLTRNIGLILKSSKDASIATKTFLLYLKFRDDGAITDSLTGILKENDIEDCKAVALDHRFNKGI